MRRCWLAVVALIGAACGSDEAPHAPGELDTSGVSPSLDVPGTLGYVQLNASPEFAGTEALMVRAEFFRVVPRTLDGSARKSVDPIDGLDDCGVFVGSDVSTLLFDPSADDFQTDSLLLRDGAAEIAIPQQPSGSANVVTYSLRVPHAAPRFGEPYEVLASAPELGGSVTLVVTLPEQLALTAPGHVEHLDKTDLTLRWTGRSDAPLRVRLVTNPRPSDLPLTNAMELVCLVEDDGEYTIPASVLSLLPDGLAQLGLTRELRSLTGLAGHHVLASGVAFAGQIFQLGTDCENPDVLAACERAAARLAEVYLECGQSSAQASDFDSACATTAHVCGTCTEYFDCQTDSWNCDPDDQQIRRAPCSCP